ncbi:hypothetical protein CC86DRAFT_472172 [Ophiobolus disseminans]|uniref:Arrestin-like N-terminal domain-containing protein n=1 Tax=Ophiobolus disseminans TaxID=1469910 RepID=A0A6A6ZEE7_9PLEO|nr:hypothetical protein CC86DRAFT_472172 [Ophiobolus disseminans]
MTSIPAQANEKQKPLHIKLFEETHPFYTSGDTVRGVLRVEPTLRPQRITLTFRGYSVIYDQASNGATPNLFTQKQDIFESSGAHENFDILKKGTAADGRVELPFEFQFPHAAELAPPSDRIWRYAQDSYDHPRFQHSPGFPLPPSCSAQVSANKGLVPRIVYALQADLESVVPDTPRVKVLQVLQFIPPAPEFDSALLQPMIELGTKLPKHCCRYKLIRSRKLLPGYGSTSKLGKVKDKLVEKELFFGLESFSEIPFARFNVLATPARVQVIGSQIPIVINVQHLDRSASLPGPPDLFMRRIRVQLLSSFHIFVPSLRHNKKEKEIAETVCDTLVLVDRKFEEGNGHALTDGLNLADMVGFRLAHVKLLPSFTSYGLALEYELQVEIWGECATREFLGIACRETVQVVSGWNATSQNAAVAEADPEPVYHELDPDAALDLWRNAPDEGFDGNSAVIARRRRRQQELWRSKPDCYERDADMPADLELSNGD